MFRNFLYLLFSCLVFVSGINAEEITNSLYLITENPRYYSNLGEANFNQEAPNFIKFEDNILYIRYSNEVAFIFTLPKNQNIIAGTYENLISKDICRNARLTLQLNKYLGETISRLEIYEIQFDQDQKLVSFAADWQMRDSRSSENILKGSIRVNSLFPVNEYFTHMVEPGINFQSTNLLYVERFKTNTGEKQELIINDRRPIYASLKENNGFELIIRDIPDGHNRFANEEIIFHVPCLSDLFGMNFFSIPPKSQNEDFTNPYDFWNSHAFSSRLSLQLKTKRSCLLMDAVDGKVIISEFIFDFRNNQVISLAIDFNISDEFGNVYNGVIRYNSSVSILAECYQQH